MKNPYITFVVTSRNDNHGKNMKEKNQYFIDRLNFQFQKYQLNAEIIIVEWNPPSDRLGLEQVLKIRKNMNNNIKIIKVKNYLHRKFDLNNNINFFQMIAKNVGIRCSSGNFILCTNIDIIFSNELIEFLKKGKLSKQTIYTCNRYDIDFNNFRIIDLETEDYLRGLTHINDQYSTKDIINKKEYPVGYNTRLILKKLINKFKEEKFSAIIKKKNYKTFIKIIKNFIFKQINTNACGDFTLLDKNSWHDLDGYYEFKGYSWHLDSLFLYKAQKKKFSFKNLKDKIFHINHKIGSGYTPGDDSLFKKLEREKISFINEEKLEKIKEQLLTDKDITKNKNWGLKDIELEVKTLSVNF